VFGYVLLSLETLFDIRNGYTPSKANAEYWENGTVDWFRMEDIRANGHVLSEALQKVSETAVKGGRKISANSIALATSATIGEHALITVECLGNQRFSFFSAKARFTDALNMRYMNYYFYKIDEWCKGHLFQGNFNTVDMGALKQLCIPLPPIEEQERIVSILDRFDSLCNDISSGLPAEIEVRQKQYEYYRDKLLTFKEQ
jgi:type I restriction enzyme, S subunit